jgi:hypothetical protein
MNACDKNFIEYFVPHILYLLSGVLFICSLLLICSIIIDCILWVYKTIARILWTKKIGAEDLEDAP